MSRRPRDRSPRSGGGRVVRLEVATGGRPVDALARALQVVSVRGELWRVSVAHDDGCPALAGGLPACTCELVELIARRAA